MMRLVISPSPRQIELPGNYQLTFGQGTVLKEGKDAIIFAYGPVMLYEVLLAAELLEEKGYSLKVVNMPWLNRVNVEWLEETVGDTDKVFAVDNHFPYGGFGTAFSEVMLNSKELKTKKFNKFAIEGFPACGTPQETLQYHRLDGECLANRILPK